MENTKYILAKPEYIETVGYIYPVKINDYDIFNQYNKVLYYSLNHFDESVRTYPLLDLLTLGLKDDETIKCLNGLFSLVLRKEVKLIQDESRYVYYVDEDHYINGTNYDMVRKVIMTQNLLFEQKVFKNETTQQWANKVLTAKSKSGIQITIEDMITTVSTITGKSYDVIGNQSIYQLIADFKRISKDKDYHTSIAMMCAGAEKVTVHHYAEQINMFENPYDSLFVGKEKLSKLDASIN